MWDGEPRQPRFVPGSQVSWEEQLAPGWAPLKAEG